MLRCPHSSRAYTPRLLGLVGLAGVVCSSLGQGVPPVTRDWLTTAIADPVAVEFNPDTQDLTLANGLIRRTWRLPANAACWSCRNLASDTEFVRAVCPEAILTIAGHPYPVGGLVGAPEYGFIDPAWLREMKPEAEALRFAGYRTNALRAPYPWRARFGAPDVPWPPPGLELILDFKAPPVPPDPTVARPGAAAVPGLTVSVHYEMYVGAPVLTKWVSVSNAGPDEVVIERMTTEQLAVPRAQSSRLHAESDYMSFRVFPLRWELDGRFATDAAPNFHEYHLGESLRYYPTEWLDNLWVVPPEQLLGRMEGGNRTLLSSRYPFGPGRHLAAGDTFTTYRTFTLLHDSDDRERQSLARRQLYRRLAPQTQENPVFFHLIRSDSESIRRAVDQCATLGFEMIILSFGSGFNMYTTNAAEIARYRADFDYAHQRGLKIGGYILFASSASHGEHDAVGPNGQLGSEYGRSLCLGTAYSDRYFQVLWDFIDATGMDVIETDGPYHGYSCSATTHAYHRGRDDSYHVMWERQCRFFRGCLERGLYIHAPDFYYFNGSNRSSLGYRESSTYLPHWTKVLVARRNLYDGTVQKTPSMGWMWDPIAPGGGPATDLNPLGQHLDLYRWHLAQIFGAGVMATWRNTVLYDDDASKALVQHWVRFFKQHRDILSSDLLHLRQPDGRDLDYFLHVNPHLREKGLLMVFNPLNEPVKRTLRLPLYYSGLTDRARIRLADNTASDVPLDRHYLASVTVALEPRGITWLVVE